VPSKFVAHRRVVQYWLHVSHDSWFAPLLSDFRGQGPSRRLQNTAALCGFTRTTETSDGRTYPISKEVRHKRVRDAVADAAARLFLQAKAVGRKLPGPAVVAKRNNLLQLVAQPYVLEGADLAKYGVARVPAECSLRPLPRVGPTARSPLPSLQRARPLCRSVPPARV
jgi:hypothetical protein